MGTKRHSSLDNFFPSTKKINAQEIWWNYSFSSSFQGTFNMLSIRNWIVPHAFQAPYTNHLFAWNFFYVVYCQRTLFKYDNICGCLRCFWHTSQKLSFLMLRLFSLRVFRGTLVKHIVSSYFMHEFKNILKYDFYFFFNR